MASRLVAILLVASLAACQSAGGPSGASGVSALEAVADEGAAAEETGGPIDETASSVDPQTGADAGTQTGSVASAAAEVKPAVDIAKLHKSKGHQAALSKVFDCYRKAQSKDVTLQQSKICAVQDFAISRATENRFKQQGKADAKNRTLIIAKRAPERIGALMQLKGMNQNQLNTFALYLHAVVLPTFEKTRA